MPAALWAIISMLASMGAWEGGRLAIKGIGRKLVGEAAGKMAASAGKKLAANAVGQTVAKGLSKSPWLAKHLPSVENIPAAAVGAVGGMAGLIGGMKAAEYTHELLNGSEVVDSDNLPAMEAIKQQASLRDAMCRATGLCGADVDRILTGGVQ